MPDATGFLTYEEWLSAKGLGNVRLSPLKTQELQREYRFAKLNYLNSIGELFTEEELELDLTRPPSRASEADLLGNEPEPGAVGRTQVSPTSQIFTGDLVAQAVNRGRPRPAPKSVTDLPANPLDGDLVVNAMAQTKRSLINEEIRDFSTGFISDTSPLQEISHGSIDEQNMLLVDDGSRARRRGLNYEDSFVRRAVTGNGVNLRSFLWLSGTDGDASVITLVPTAGTYTNSSLTLDLFDLDPTDVATRNISANYTASQALTQTNVLRATSTITPATWGNEFYIPLSYESATIQLMAITAEGSTRIATTRALKLRDHWGIDDTLKVTERPGTLAAAHFYNLVNQGWSFAQANSFFNVMAVYPSNADVPYNGRDTNNVYIAARLNERPFPAGAPKGSVIIDMTDFDRTEDQKVVDEFAAASLSTAGLTTDVQGIELTHMSEFAGRVFFAFTRSNNYAGGNNSVPDMEHFLLFSRSITHSVRDTDNTNPSLSPTSLSTAIDCYSIFDLTSEDFALADADGGFYALPEVGKVQGLSSVGNTLYVLANNGIWAMRSTAGLFEPTAAVLEKVTSIGCISPESIVKAEQSIFFLGRDGLYSIVTGQGSSAVNRISRNKIDVWLKSRTNDIRDVVYDSALNEVKWLIQKPHNAGNTGWQETGSELRQEELVYNLVTTTFTKNRFANVELTVSGTPNVATVVVSGTYVAGYVQLPGAHITSMPTRNENGATADEDVTRHTAVDVRRSIAGIKYLVKDTTGYTFSDMSGLVYEDFTVTANEAIEGFLIGLYDNDLDSQRKRQVGHLTTHFYRTELGTQSDGGGGWEAINQGGCLLDYYWDHEQRSPNERAARQHNIYKLLRGYTITPGGADPYDYGEAVITTRTKIRGRGRSLQLEFRTTGSKDMQLLGWGITKKINRRS